MRSKQSSISEKIQFHSASELSTRAKVFYIIGFWFLLCAAMVGVEPEDGMEFIEVILWAAAVVALVCMIIMIVSLFKHPKPSAQAAYGASAAPNGSASSAMQMNTAGAHPLWSNLNPQQKWMMEQMVENIGYLQQCRQIISLRNANVYGWTQDVWSRYLAQLDEYIQMAQSNMTKIDEYIGALMQTGWSNEGMNNLNTLIQNGLKISDDLVIQINGTHSGPDKPGLPARFSSQNMR